MRVSERIAINEATRQSILDRDSRRCQKCGRTFALELHHIKAVMNGGDNDPDNLITLCYACHLEWGVIEALDRVPFAAWLPLPTLEVFIDSFVGLDFSIGAWPDNFTAKEWHEVICAIHMARKCGGCE